MNENNRNSYFKMANEISSSIDEDLRIVIESNNLGVAIQSMYKKRIGKIKIRTVIMELLAELKGIKFDRKLLLVPELSNYRLYLSNMIFDDKNNINEDKASLKSAVLDLHLIDGIVQDIFRNSSSPVGSAEMEKIYFDSNYQCHLGQQKEMELNIIDFTNIGEKDFWNTYMEKSRLLTGRPYRISADLLGLKKFGDLVESFGTVMHISNDVTDFIPNNEDFKLYQDNLSDFKNGRINPVTYHLAKSGNLDYFNKDLNWREVEELTLSLLEKGSFEYGIQKVNPLKNKLERDLKKLIPNKKERRVFSEMFSVIRSNTQMRELRKIIKG